MKYKKLFFAVVFLNVSLISFAQQEAGKEANVKNWENFGDSIDNAYFFVLNKIISIQGFFIDEAKKIGAVILLIALLTAALNYILTGQGLKENLIKILKATLFFFIVVFAYPRIIGWITSYAYYLAYNNIGKSVEKYYEGKLYKMDKAILEHTGTRTDVYKTTNYEQTGGTVGAVAVGVTSMNSAGALGGYYAGSAIGSSLDEKYKTSVSSDTFRTLKTLTGEFFQSTPELKKIFSKATKVDGVAVKGYSLDYTSFAPAAVVELLLVTADNAFSAADNVKKNRTGFPTDLGLIVKGLLCGFFLIFTGIFALVEYLVCMLEFMLVASVAVILLPMAIWDGSKFLTEGLIKAIVGFFFKLFISTLAVFLLLYGYVSMFHVIGTQKFAGSVDQLGFIFFTCILFFIICKSAPGIAQAIVTGSPSLNAAGAIGAVAGAAGAVAATASYAKSAGSKLASAGGALTGGGVKAGMALSQANAAGEASKAQGGSKADAFMSSLGSQASEGVSRSLARSIYGSKSGDMTLGELKGSKKMDGAIQGVRHANRSKSS